MHDYFADPNLDQDLRGYLAMLLIRRVEETIGRLFVEGKVSGTTHLCVGQEANAVGFIGRLDPAMDFVSSTHRCHGHYLAFGGRVEALLGEIMGRACGVCQGYGGSQHLSADNFFSSGIQGGFVPIACGVALGKKKRGQGGIAVSCLGDGTLGQGIVYEALNMASLLSLPIIFLVENNGYAQTTPTPAGVAGSITARGEAFGIKAVSLDSTDLAEIAAWADESMAYVRTEGKPLWAEIKTNRLCAHSKGDDPRPREELDRCWAADPLAIQGARLTEAQREQAEERVAGMVAQALAEAEASPCTAPEGEART